jgi:hypothetical protein
MYPPSTTIQKKITIQNKKNERKVFASYTSDKRLITTIFRDLKKTNPTKNQQPTE